MTLIKTSSIEFLQLYIDWHENHGFTHDKQNGRVLTFISNILYELTRCFSKILKYTNADHAKSQKALPLRPANFKTVFHPH